jgi:tetratricopeptide (TPR) repeat protein
MANIDTNIDIGIDDRENQIPDPSLSRLCDSVLSLRTPYDDIAEQIEDAAYFEYEQGGLEHAVELLKGLSRFFEGLRNKSEEVSRDLAQVYLLIGQIYLYAGKFEDSIAWINNSIVVDDMYPVAYHSLALAFRSIGDESMSVKSLEQEIRVAPGNYYSYLLLADLYEKNGDFARFEDVLRRLLERAPDNVQGLHRLIRHCERVGGAADVDLLRRRLLGNDHGLSRIEAVIRAYHLAQAGREREAAEFLEAWGDEAPDVSINHLANAHIYGQMSLHSKKRRELSLFRIKNHAREDVMEIKIAEFAFVFGEEAAEKIRRSLRVAGMSQC